MDRNSYRLIGITLLLLLLLFWVLPERFASAAEITNQQLTAIETKLNRLEELRLQSQIDLRTLNNQLQISQKELTAARQQLATLQMQLAESKETSKNQENLLQRFTESYKQLEKQKAKKVMNEYSLLIDPEAGNYIGGIGFGKYYKIENISYLGGRLEYDWQDNKVNFWVSLLN